MQTGNERLKWIIPETYGIPPTPRYMHSINFMPKSNMIVVFGGRNDSLYKSSGKCFLNDVCLLSLDSLTWVTIQTFGDIPSPRCFHAAEVLENSLIIMGGIGTEVINSKLYILEIN